MNKNSGFTLIELMVTLSIAAILMGIAVPSFQTTIKSNRIVTQTNQLVTALNLARSEAIKRGVQVTVCKSADRATCTTNGNWDQSWLVFVDSVSPIGTKNTDDLVLRSFEPVPQGVMMRSGTNFANFISYKSSGVSQGGNDLATDTFGICDDRGVGFARALSLSNTGRVIKRSGSEITTALTTFTCPTS